MNIEDIKVGLWAVYIEGEYGMVTNTKSSGEVYAYWYIPYYKHNGERYIDRCDGWAIAHKVIGAYETKKEAEAMADLIIASKEIRWR